MRQGYCQECEHRVLLTEPGACPNGHGWPSLRDVREATPDDEARLASGYPLPVSPPAGLRKVAPPGERRAERTGRPTEGMASAWAFGAGLAAGTLVMGMLRILALPGTGWVRYVPILVATAVTYALVYLWLRRR